MTGCMWCHADQRGGIFKIVPQSKISPAQSLPVAHGRNDSGVHSVTIHLKHALVVP